MSWIDNAAMFWALPDANGNPPTSASAWNKISDHNRAAIEISVERIEKKDRMVNGTMRRYVVAKKRTFSTSWTMLPAKSASSYNGVQGLGTVDGGYGGEDIENWHNNVNGMFYLKLRKGTDEAKAITDGTIEVVKVMLGDFGKTIEKRGIVDLWSVSVSLEEV